MLGCDQLDNTYWNFENETITLDYEDEDEVVFPFVTDSSTTPVDIDDRTLDGHTMPLIRKCEGCYVPAAYRGREAHFQLDTGTQSSFISLNYLEKCGLGDKIISRPNETITFFNQTVEVVGEIILTLDFWGKPVTIFFIVLPERNILGRHFLYHYKCQFHVCDEPMMRFGHGINTENFYGNSEGEALIGVKYSYAGIESQAYIDTGAWFTSVGINIARDLKLDLVLEEDEIINGLHLPNAYSVPSVVDIQVGSTIIELPRLRVVDIVDFFLLGFDGLENTYWDFEKQTIIFDYGTDKENVMNFIKQSRCDIN